MPWCKYWDCELESWDECEGCIMLTQETAHVAGTKDDCCLIRFCDALKMGDIRPIETYDSRRDEWRI
jgi:hypothetical protein